MSIRGEMTETIRRQGEHRVRERLDFEEETDFPSKETAASPAWERHPRTLFEPEAWHARFGLRCGGPAPETKNP